MKGSKMVPFPLTKLIVKSDTSFSLASLLTLVAKGKKKHSPLTFNDFLTAEHYREPQILYITGKWQRLSTTLAWDLCIPFETETG